MSVMLSVVFSGDTRFMVLHPSDSIEWNLKIDQVTSKDSGFYGNFFLTKIFKCYMSYSLYRMPSKY